MQHLVAVYKLVINKKRVVTEEVNTAAETSVGGLPCLRERYAVTAGRTASSKSRA